MGRAADPNIGDTVVSGTPAHVEAAEPAAEPAAVYSYLPSGHDVKKSKDDGGRVNRRPRTFPSEVWSSTGPSARLKWLNEYRKARNLRQSSSWKQMDDYLMEELGRRERAE